jgi:hypothetical protein
MYPTPLADHPKSSFVVAVRGNEDGGEGNAAPTVKVSFT